MSKITDSYLKKLKVENGEDKMFSIGDSLWLRISHDRKGELSKRWILRYVLNGKQGKIMLGHFPKITLLEARNIANDLKEMAKAGIKPEIKSKYEKVDAENFFRNIADSWLARKSVEWTETTLKKNSSRLQSYIYPFLGDISVNEINKNKVDEAMKKIYLRGKIYITRCCLYIIQSVLQHAMSNGVLKDSRILLELQLYAKNELPKAPPKRHLYEGMTDDDIGELLLALDESRQRWTLSASSAIRLAPYVFVRPGELCSARWDEFDLDAALWRIPATKMKMRRDHVVPLSTQALAILMEIRQWTGQHEYVFHSNHRGERHINPTSLLRILRRLGYSSKLGTGSAYFTTHGFRGMATTLLYERFEFPSMIIELQLAHMDGNQVRASYNAITPYSYLEKRKEMIQKYADFLDDLKEKARLKKEIKFDR